MLISNLIKSNLNFFIFIFFVFLSGEILPSTSVPIEIFASAKSLIKGSIFITEFSSFLGYDQALINGEYISTHPIGNTLISFPAIVIIGIPIEYILENQVLYTFHPKEIFHISSQISYLATSLILFLVFVNYLKKLFIELGFTYYSKLIFLFAVSYASSLYLSYSLRESFLTSLILLMVVSIYLNFLTGKNKYAVIASISLFFLILIREYYLVLIFIIPLLLLIRKDRIKLTFYLTSSYILAAMVLLIYNYLITSKFSLLIDMMLYFDPNGPDRLPPARLGQETFNNLNLIKILMKFKIAFFNYKIGILSFYLFEHLIFIISSIFIFKNIDRNKTFIFVLVCIIYSGSFIFFNILYNFNPVNPFLLSHRHMAPQISLLFLIIFFTHSFLKKNIVMSYLSFLFIILVSIKNLILIFTSIRFPKAFFKNDQFLIEINSAVEFISYSFKNFGCNIFNQPTIKNCYIDTANLNHGLISILSFSLLIFLIYQVVLNAHFIYFKNSKN